MSLILSMLDANQSLGPGSTPTFAGVKTNLNVGTVATGSSVVEYGDGFTHTSVITVNTTLGAIAGGANLGLGKLIYTFPAGTVIIDEAYISMAITQTQGNINADTPDVGLGTTVASGAVPLLSGTAAFENVLTGHTAANCTGTATVATTSSNTEIAPANDHTLYFNVADGWAASGDAAALLTGTIVIDWNFMN